MCSAKKPTTTATSPVVPAATPGALQGEDPNRIRGMSTLRAPGSSLQIRPTPAAASAQ